MESNNRSVTKTGYKHMSKKLETLRFKLEEILKQMEEVSRGESTMENVQYIELVEQKLEIESECTQLEEVLDGARIVKKRKSGKASIGCYVKLVNHTICHIFQLVESIEADPLLGKISLESPLGKSIKDKVVGDEVRIHTPAGDTSFNLVSIQ